MAPSFVGLHPCYTEWRGVTLWVAEVLVVVLSPIGFDQALPSIYECDQKQTSLQEPWTLLAITQRPSPQEPPGSPPGPQGRSQRRPGPPGPPGPPTHSPEPPPKRGKCTRIARTKRSKINRMLRTADRTSNKKRQVFPCIFTTNIYRMLSFWGYVCGHPLPKSPPPVAPLPDLPLPRRGGEIA